MSVINHMLRDLDRRAATPVTMPMPAGQGAAASGKALPPGTPASGYAAARMAGGTVRRGRSLAVACGVVAMLPIAWAATLHERSVAGVPVAGVPAPTVDGPAKQADAMVTPAATIATIATVATPIPAARAPVPADPAPEAGAAPASPAVQKPRVPRPVAATPPVRVAMLGSPKAVLAASPSAATAPARPAPDVPAAPKGETLIERLPTDARDDLARAGEAMAIGRVSEAIALLRKLIHTDPYNEQARLALLSLLAERGRDDTWRTFLSESARAMPARFGMAAAQGLAESGRYEQGLAILKGMPESARDLRYFAALGVTRQQLSQHAEAVDAFAAALALAPAGSPQTPALLVAQSMSMQSLGNAGDAQHNLERVRAMPDASAELRDFAARELSRRR